MKRLLLIALALTGCATPPNWQKAGSSAQSFKEDSYSCQRDVRQAVNLIWEKPWSMNPGQDVYEDCMKAHGWTPAANVDTWGNDLAMPELLSTQAHVKPALLQISKPWTVKQWTRT